MLKNLLDENDKLKIKTETIQKFDSSNAKLSSENKMNLETTSEFDEESEMSEISVEDEIDCSEFLKIESEKAKSLVSENSVEFARISKDKSKVVKEKSVVCRKV